MGSANVGGIDGSSVRIGSTTVSVSVTASVTATTSVTGTVSATVSATDEGVGKGTDEVTDEVRAKSVDAWMGELVTGVRFVRRMVFIRLGTMRLF
jgi:hypothetical protein